MIVIVGSRFSIYYYTVWVALDMALGLDANMSWMKSPSATKEYLKSQPGFAIDHKSPVQVAA